jgi:HEAT repeat protein
MRGLLLVALLATLSPWAFTTAQTSDKEKEKKFYVTEIGGKTLDQWIKEIPSADRSKGENAIQNVLLFPLEQASTALPYILNEMGKHKAGYPIDLSIRVNGAIAIGMLLGAAKEPDPKHVKEAVKILTAGLSDTQAIMRYRSAEALGRIGPEARSAIPGLLAAVADGATWEVREAASLALGNVARDPKEGPSATVLAKLYYALDDKACQVRLAAVRSLAMLGIPTSADSKNAWVRSLEKTAKDPDTRIVIWGQMAIMRVLNEVPEPRLQIIGKLLGHPEAGTRIQAAQALTELGNKARSQIPLLIKGLKDRTPEAAGWCVTALARMGLAAAAAVPELQALAKDMNQPELLRRVAAEAIDMIQGKASKGMEK